MNINEVLVLFRKTNKLGRSIDQAIKDAGGVGIEPLLSMPFDEVLLLLAQNYIDIHAYYAPSNEAPKS
jgi:hypothetical protein